MKKLALAIVCKQPDCRKVKSIPITFVGPIPSPSSHDESLGTIHVSVQMGFHHHIRKIITQNYILGKVVIKENYSIVLNTQKRD